MYFNEIRCLYLSIIGSIFTIGLNQIPVAAAPWRVCAEAIEGFLL